MAAMDFQKATANRIISLFTDKEHPRSRVLLADEVGLGKTIVAKEVLSLMREWRKSVNDDFFRVVYICSNINIAKQNIVKLGIKEKLGVDESRLSMQHILIASKEKDWIILKNCKYWSYCCFTAFPGRIQTRWHIGYWIGLGQFPGC